MNKVVSFDIPIISRKEAKAKGLKRYFTGKECKNHHISERQISSGSCLKCHAEKQAKAYKENPSNQIAIVMKYRRNNRELIKLCVEEVKDKLIVNPPVVVFNKPGIQHRAIGFLSDESIGYYYSNKLARSIPLTPNLKKLLEAVNNYFSENYNAKLIKYLDQLGSVGLAKRVSLLTDEGLIND